MTSGGMGRKARWRATLATAILAALPLSGALPAARDQALAVSPRTSGVSAFQTLCRGR